METRKVQLTGGSTYVVSLPKRWVLDSGIQKNDYVGIIPRDDGSLIVTSKVERSQKARKKSFMMEGDAEGDHLLRKLVGAYMTGYSEIEVRMKPRLSTDVRSAVRDFSRMTIGTEIIEETTNLMVVKDLLDPSDLPFQKSTRRMYYISRRMLFDAVQAFVNNDQELALDVTSRDVEVDRLNWLMARQYHMIMRDLSLAEKLGTSATTAINYILISRLIERIADHSCKICLSVQSLESVELPDKLRKWIGRLGEKSVDLFDQSVDAFFREDTDGLNEIIDLVDRAISECDRLVNKVSRWGEEGAVALSYIIESIRRAYSYARDIAEVAINHLVDISN